MAYGNKPSGKAKAGAGKYGPSSMGGEMANSKKSAKMKMKGKDGSYETNKGIIKVDKKKSKRMK